MDEEDSYINRIYHTVSVVCHNCGEIVEKEIIISSDGAVDIDEYDNEQTNDE